jgi:hypothetical protein
LTNFAILIGGGGGSGALDDPCKAGQIYMMHSFDKHMIVLACVTGAILFALIIAAILLSFTPRGQRLLYGQEGYRVHRARSVPLRQQDAFHDNDEEIGSGFA